MEDAVPARFKPGDRVLARNINPIGHTRLPRYARGRHGVIHRDHGVFVFPDTMAAESAASPSIAIACASTRPSCGDQRPWTATPSTSICSSPIWSGRDEPVVSPRRTPPRVRQ